MLMCPRGQTPPQIQEWLHATSLCIDLNYQGQTLFVRPKDLRLYQNCRPAKKGCFKALIVRAKSW